jgi:transcriptional regulator with XRE-family HTH domain
MSERLILDAPMLRRRRAELGLSVRAVADAIGIGAAAYTAVENGHRHSTLAFDTVLRLARLFGATVDELLARSDQLAATPAEDVAALGALLMDIGTLTPVGTLLEVLDWSLERLHRAEAQLADALAACGLALRRSASRLAIVDAARAVDPNVLAAAMRRHQGRNHMSLLEARLLRCVEHDDVPTQPSNAERVALQTLVNSGLITFGPSGTKNAEAPLVLADDVVHSLLLDEDPGGPGYTPARRRRSTATLPKRRNPDPKSAHRPTRGH